MPSEADLLAQARLGDADAFATLIEPHQRRAYNLALRLLGDPDEAADVAQDALVRVYTRLGDFRGDAAFSTWLHRIVHNMCLDALRWRARHPALSLSGGPREEDGVEREIGSTAEDPADAAVRADQRQAIRRALDGLSVEFRSVVVLRDVQGLDYEEIAAITGVGLGTVKSRLHRARSRLRDLLGDMEPETGRERLTE